MASPRPRLARPLLAAALMLVLAPLLHGASANDLVGIWSVDGDATWAILRKSPTISKQLTGVPADVEDQVKGAVLNQVALTTYQFTTEKLVSITNGQRREEQYKISHTDGNVLTADCIDDTGKASQSKVTVGTDRLEIQNVGNPDEVVVLKRAH